MRTIEKQNKYLCTSSEKFHPVLCLEHLRQLRHPKLRDLKSVFTLILLLLNVKMSIFLMRGGGTISKLFMALCS